MQKRGLMVNEEKITLDGLVRDVSNCIYEEIKRGRTSLYGASDENLFIENHNKLEDALRECLFLDADAKALVKDKIKEILYQRFDLNEYNLNQLIPFDNSRILPLRFKFSILLNKYKQKFEKDALKRLIEKYGIDDVKTLEDNSCAFTIKNLNDIYSREKIVLDFKEKLDIIVQYIYSKYKGYGVIDEILEMNIDGINGGVNGTCALEDEKCFSNVWIMFKGKNLLLEFLNFESEDELKRICQNIYKFDNPGELSLSEGYKINKMKDGSRVVVIRPPFGESWMFFIRKFHISNLELEDLIVQENNEMVIEFLKYIMKSCQNVCVSGQQGSGKTTMLLNLIKYIYPFYPIRVCEMAFELNLRRKYPNRNICTLQETENITGQEALDLLKKTDGLINVIGEVASDEVASQLIQSGQVAAKSTIFTHHANDFKKLIMSLRNSLLKTKNFTNEIIAQQQVVSVIDFDIHMAKDFYGNRYIERITECIETKDGYEENEIVVFKNRKYCLKNLISDKRMEKMKNELNDFDKVEFEKFNDEVLKNEKYISFDN